MHLQLKPNRWSCLLTSFAMAFDIPVRELCNLVGHDGSQVLWPGLPEPTRRRGFHPHEFTLVALRRGWAVTPLELVPAMHPTKEAAVEPVLYGGSGRTSYPANWSIFTNLIHTSLGVITGVGRKSGHAVAYDRGQIYDPDGSAYEYTRAAAETRGFYTHCLWIVSYPSDLKVKVQG
jgi:hypothetical protein